MKALFQFSYILFLSILLFSCKKSFTDIVKETENATFIIYTYDEFGSPNGSGSGFFIDKNGTGITNYHVLNNSVKAVIKMTDSTEYEIEKVIVSDRKWDIAKFQVKNQESKNFPFLKFSKNTLQKGEKVYNISSPMGLEHSLSEGIVSSFRKDKQHGEVVQITAPISPGSSGSAILNEKGEVFAIAAYNRKGGQNLNFGILVNEDKLNSLTNNDFAKANPKFNSIDDDFILLNIPSNRDAELILNAIEFGKSMTTLYLTYTNLNMASGDSYGIWCELNKKEEGFLIHDKNSDQKYYVTSSTIGVDKEHFTEVPLASTVKFKAYFPAIKSIPEKIDVIYGYTTRGWQFTDIELSEYRENININPESYQKEYAFSIMHEGELDAAQSIFLELLEDNPDDINALNAMGLVSYVVDNNSDALYYFSEAIDKSPNNTTAYVNRYQVYKYQKNYTSALDDITKAINITPDQPDLFVYRATLYMDTEDWKNAKPDLDHAIATDDFKTNVYVYLYRIYTNTYLGNYKEVCKDIYTAYNLTNDKEIEQQLQETWNACGCR
jgi:serine protease Do